MSASQSPARVSPETLQSYPTRGKRTSELHEELKIHSSSLNHRSELRITRLRLREFLTACAWNFYGRVMSASFQYRHFAAIRMPPARRPMGNLTQRLNSIG